MRNRLFLNAIGVSSIIIATLLFSGCGGGGSADTSSSRSGSLTLRLTDAPVDDLFEVWVTFSKVIVNPADDGLAPIEYIIDPPMSIELKALGSGQSVTLVENEPLPAGDYSWVRLYVDPWPETFVYETRADADSDNRVMLDCPSCDAGQSGLKLNRPFTIENEGIVDYTIDFDLRKSITDPVGQPGYKLRPTLRIVETDVASVQFAGTVTDTQSSPGNPVDPASCAVYIYEGAGITPDDNCVNDDATVCENVGDQPYTAADLETTATENEYSYLSGYMDEGTYTVTLACGEDFPDADDDLVFIGTTPVDPASPGQNIVDFTIND